MTTITTLADQLEAVIDAHTLPEVLSAIASICQEKAVHIEQNWQDQQTARVWHKAADALDRVTDTAAIRNLR